jgi:hypothetical protein
MNLKEEIINILNRYSYDSDQNTKIIYEDDFDKISTQIIEKVIDDIKEKLIK